MLSGIDNGEDPVEECPGRLEPGDDRLGRLPVGQPHEAVPRVAGGEDQGPHQPPFPGRRVDQEPHLAEVDLELPAGLPVVDPHRGLAPAEAALRHREAVQRPIRNLNTLAGQQLVDLDQVQLLVVDPRLDRRLLRPQRLPRRPVTGRAGRAHPQAHLPDQQIGQLLLAALTDQTGGHRRLHVTADRLAVDPTQTGDGPEALTTHPQTQNLTDLEHGHLPVGHAAPSVHRTTGTESNVSPTGGGGPDPCQGSETDPGSGKLSFGGCR